MADLDPCVFVEFIDKEVPLPQRATPGSAGYDICSNETKTLLPGQYGKIGTGLRFAIPEGYEIQVRPRSGLAAKHGVTVLNAPGTIDSDYRGEVGILLINHGDRPFSVEAGMRIAQLVFSRVETAGFEKRNLEKTARGGGGFGSTGR